MRIYGYLKEPYPCGNGRMVYKVMLHEIPGEGTYTYYYTDRDAVFSSYDSYSEDWDAAAEEFAGALDERGWMEIGDPLPFCQHDSILPIRVKGREAGRPQWGAFEILSDGKWVDYQPPVPD